MQLTIYRNGKQCNEINSTDPANIYKHIVQIYHAKDTKRASKTKNAAQKILIDALITTHQNPAKAFKKALHTATTQKDGETLKRIAKAFKINIQAPTMETITTNGERLTVEIDTDKSAGGWLILTQYDKDGNTKRRDSITGDEFAKMWEQEQDKRNQ